jgi:predicted nucleotide-binding protein (sugar kinase/HSP70/actin superfamily)
MQLMDNPSFRCGRKTMAIVEYRHLEMYEQYPIFFSYLRNLKTYIKCVRDEMYV